MDMFEEERTFPHNNDVWNLRRNWQTVKPDLQKQLLDGTYQFSPQQEIRFDTETIELWASLDASRLSTRMLSFSLWMGRFNHRDAPSRPQVVD